MKNFTKQNIKTCPLWIKLLIMSFMLLAGTSSAWGWTIYYDNSVTKWAEVYAFIGHNSYSRGNYKMTKVSGADELYSYTATDWGDATQLAFHCVSWGEENSSITHRRSYHNNTGYGTIDQTISTVVTGFTGLSNKNNQVYTYNKAGGTMTTTSYATTYKITTSATNGTITVKNGSTTISSGGTVKYRSVINITVTPSSGYNLKNGKIKINDTEYTYTAGMSFTVTKATTITATFEKSCTLPTSVSITGATTPCAESTQTYTANITGGSDYELVWTVPNGYTITSEEGTTSIKVTVGTASGDITCTAKCNESSTKSSKITVSPINVVTPTISIDNEWVCPNASATITVGEAQLNKNYTYTLYNSSNNSQVGTSIVNPTTAPVAFSISTPGTYYVKATHSCGDKSSTKTVTLRNYTKPEIPKYEVTKATACGASNPNRDGAITLNNPVVGVTYTLTKGSVAYEKQDNKFISLESGSYTLTATLDACPTLKNSAEIKVEADDITPVVEELVMPADFEACNGTSVTIALQNFTKEEGCSYQFTWQYSTNGGTSYTTGTISNSATSYTRTLNGTTKFRVQVTKSKDGCTSPVATSDAVTVTANSLSEPTVSIISASYDMNAGTFTVSGRLDHAGCSNDIYVGYRYKLSNDDTWSELINTHRLTEAGIFTKEGITIAGATAGQKYIFQTYAINGYPNYQESSAVLSSSTIEVEVQDGYTVYVRRPKSGDNTNVYTNWYELSSVKGGAPYVKSGAISGSKDNNKATTNNTGGTEMTYAFTDCDGFIWDSFKPAKNQTQFHIHALNDDQQNGWGTFSKTATITAGKDNYFYLSAWSSGTYGVTITSTDQPTRGVRIKALGSTQIISTNMASFAAISFNGNCTGKELLKDSEGDPTGFQWKYFAPETSTWSNYDGEGATWNNIRPTKAGKYKLVCTMEDMTTVESNEVTITTTSKTYNASDLININSALPIIMVNTGDNNGFPACGVAGSDYPSKHADKFKKKLSVDVKIKVGENIVYDKKARMAFRGSSSLNFKKKSYAFCPGADMCGLDEDETPDFVDTKKIDMLDLITGGTKKSAKDKDWVLYAATPDPSMMRNILAMETFAAMTGNWGVKNQYVELYVDGEYQGVYVFMDKITQNKGRVDIEWEVDGSSKEFIVKFDKTDLADRYEIPNGDQKTFESSMKTGNTGVISYGTEIDQRFEIEYPEKEDVVDDGGSWADVHAFVKGKIDAFESALKDGDFNTVRTIIDYESWADFFILTEFAKNGDGFRASCVFVYEDGLLRAYPLWDYELSFDNETRQEHGIDSEEGLLVKQTTYNKVSGDNGTFPAPFWWTGNYYNQKTYKGLLDDPCFIAMVKARWTAHTTGEGALTKAKLQALVDKYNTALTTTDATTTYNTPQKREQQKWPYNGDTRGLTCNSKEIGYFGKGAGSAISEVETFSSSKTTLDNWIGDNGRRGGLNTEIENLAKDIKFAITVVADKTTTTPWRPVTVTVNSNSGYEYSITPEPAKLEENGHMYTLYFARPERTEGTNFDTINDAYTFTATTGQADQCGTTQGSTTSAEVKINLADVEENCD